MYFSLIIPCFNEEKNIPLLINKYRNFLKKKQNELILVDNGSIDQTGKVLKKLKRINIKTCTVKKNKGYGNGLKKGIKFARGEVIIFSHADLEVDPKDIAKAIKIYQMQKPEIKKKIFIKANRVNKLKNSWTLSDIFFSYGLTFFTTLLFRRFLKDIHGQPVLFNKKILKNLSYFPDDFSVDLAFFLEAKKKNYNIIRFPVNFNKKNRKYGEGSSDNLIKKIKGSINQIFQSFIILFK